MNSIVLSKEFLYCAVFLISLSTCQKQKATVLPAFYHWKTQLKIDSTEARYLEKTQTKRLYVKFFDVDWDVVQQQAIPKASLQIQKNGIPYANLKLDIIPTIFITNQTFKQLSIEASDELSARIWDKIQRLVPSTDFKEIQFDCDWTLSTRVAYFDFLEQFKKQIPATSKLSVTIRLHQYRYPEKTGVPAVDRGILMFYNMGDLGDWEEANSILNLEKAKPYLQNGKYPIPLDIAMPIFQWGVLFRENKMIKLINGLGDKRLADTSFYEALPLVNHDRETPRYKLKKSTYLDGYYLYKGDEIRLESVSTQQLKKAAYLLKNVINSDTTYLSFYHLDTPLLEKYNYDIFKKCAAILSEPME